MASSFVTGAAARRARIAGTTLVFALCLASMALAARAEAYVYWTNGSGGPHTIGRANLDGTGVDNFFIPGAGGLSGLAVDADHVYWAGGRLGRANLDGTGVENFFIGADSIAIDGDHIYWPRFESIGRANLDGGGANEWFISLGGAFAAQSVAVDARHVYWTSAWGGIGRANLDGTGVDNFFIRVNAASVAVDARHVYWTSAGAIGRANIDGTAVDPGFLTMAGTPRGVAVDAGHVYWANPWTNSIGRANLDGTSPDESFIPASNPFGIAVDSLSDPTPPDTTDPDDTAPQTTIAKGPPNKLWKRAVRFRFTSPEPDSTFECKLDAKTYRACESPHEVKRLVVGKHRFKVRAIDAAGNVDPSAAKDRFKVVKATTNEGGRR